MRKIKAVQVSRAGGGLEVVERDISETGPGQVGIRVQACGVCHSDVFTKGGLFPGISYPRVPGHEVAGIVDAVGPGVKGWTKGDRVGVGWHGGQDGTCTACRKGDFANCANVLVCGLSYDGGYQEYMIAPVEALARMPESLDPVEAAPLMCAGITTFNALRHSGAMAGDLVAVQGVGGLGHLGIQFAKKAGYRLAAVGRGTQNAAIAEKTRSGSLYRQRCHRRCSRTAEAGWCKRRTRHRAEWKGDVFSSAGINSKWHARCCGRFRRSS